jgi:DNA-binding transcriptional ArsR family regulator
MVDSKVDLILHPIRMRIIMALAGERWTARQIAAALPDVAQATLYRHINALAEGGILRIVEERPVRGMVEKVYALADKRALNLSESTITDWLLERVEIAA